MILRLVGFFAILGFLIFVHELGHYLAARLAGVKVEEFGMGYPPRLAKLFRFQGTDFTLNWIPYGGFARLKGTDDGDRAPDAFDAASPLNRTFILLAGVGMNLLVAIVCFAVTYRAGVPVSAGLPELTEIGRGSVAEILSLEEGDIVLTVEGAAASVPMLTEWVGINGLRSAPVGSSEASGQVTVMNNGALKQLPLTGDIDLKDLLDGSQYRPVLSTMITAVEAASPAEGSGLEVGDRIYSLAAEPVSLFGNSLIERTQAHAGREVSIEVLRGGTEWVSARITPRMDPPDGQGPLGITVSTTSRIGYVRSVRAALLGLTDTLGYVWATLRLPAEMIRDRESDVSGSLVGPVGIASMVGDAIEATTRTGLWLPVLRLTGALSAALAVVNLLPLPALDGGRLLFVVIEVVRRRPVHPERARVVHFVGMALLLVLMVALTVQDVTDPQQPIDWYGLLGN
ncbi:MAG: RIP metalloprotease RseP [Caldilineaceae bacterium]|nr:RIP metalloprotease RseP [Caldilineaceae bacterium]